MSQGTYYLKISNANPFSDNPYQVLANLFINNEKPVISGADDQTVFVNANFNPRDGVKAEDSTDGDLSTSVSTSKFKSL